MAVYKCKRKVVIEGRQSPLWVDVALTVMISDYQGQTRVSVVDERTGEKYPAFPLEQRGQQQSKQQQSNVDSDDVPF